jgi:hypothetical protein
MQHSDLLLQHPYETLTTYIWNIWNTLNIRLQHVRRNTLVGGCVEKLDNCLNGKIGAGRRWSEACGEGMRQSGRFFFWDGVHPSKCPHRSITVPHRWAYVWAQQKVSGVRCQSGLVWVRPARSGLHFRRIHPSKKKITKSKKMSSAVK